MPRPVAWEYFGAADTVAENVREDQVKIIKYNPLIAHQVIFQNCHRITRALKDLEAPGKRGRHTG